MITIVILWLVGTANVALIIAALSMRPPVTAASSLDDATSVLVRAAWIFASLQVAGCALVVGGAR